MEQKIKLKMEQYKILDLNKLINQMLLNNLDLDLYFIM